VKNIIVFASGTGSNAVNITRYFQQSNKARVVALFCNNPKAAVIEKMKALNIPVVLFDKNTFADEVAFSALLKPYKPDLLVLAGFLWLVPAYLVQAYPKRIINIHPALLPKFGGKGMYGHHVHEAVIASGENEHGITIHFVNEKYDEGEAIVQAKFDVPDNADLNWLQDNISKLEMHYYPLAIERVLERL
jgi:phosphoribosylglycinamide formyltransferase-1